MKPDSDKGAIPDLLLERYRLNEASAAEKADIERRLREDATLRERLAEIERSDAEIRASDFTASLATHVEDTAARRSAAGSRRVGSALRRILHARASRRASARILRWALPLAVGVAAMVVVVVGSRSGSVRPDPSGERIKGLRPSLSVFRQTPAGSEKLADASTARAGDVVRLAYQAAGQSHGVIVSIDGRGGVTVHLPPIGGMAARLKPGDRVLLDQAYELDDAPRWECFYFVTAPAPFDVQPIVDAAKRAAAGHPASPPSTLPVSQSLEQSRFVLQKAQRP